MSAGDHLSKQFMYHYSPAGNRASIEKHGLLTRHPETGESFAEKYNEPAGVYLFHNRDDAMLDDGDVWEVNVKGLKLHEDPYQVQSIASYSPRRIHPKRLRHLGEV